MRRVGQELNGLISKIRDSIMVYKADVVYWSIRRKVSEGVVCRTFDDVQRIMRENL